jgi:hypothetical protein
MSRFIKPYYSTSIIALKPYYTPLVASTGAGSGQGTSSGDPILDDLLRTVEKKLLTYISFEEINFYSIELIKYSNKIENSDPNYMNNGAYLEINVVLNQIDNQNRLNLLNTEVNNLRTDNQDLRNQLEACGCYGNHTMLDEKHGINIDTAIKVEYLQYIIEYGIPDDGIFDPSKLNRIKLNLGII